MVGHKHNAGCGREFCFHGAFKDKSKAVEKEAGTPGSFILPANYPPYSIQDRRYAVLTPRKNPAPGSIRFTAADLRKRNMAIEWMQENSWNYHNAQAMAEDAARKYGARYADLLPAARAIKLGPKANPLFSRAETKAIGKSIKRKVKGGLRSLFGFGEKAQPRSSTVPHKHRSAGRSSAVRDEVIEGLVAQGFPRAQARKMAPQAQPGEDFQSLFKRALKRNPEGEDAEGENAREVFRQFHGTDRADKVFDLENDLVRQKKFALLARMYGFDMKAFPRYYVDDPETPSGRRQEPNLALWKDNILLCSDAPKIIPSSGKTALAKQLFLWGGNQNIDKLLPDFGIESDVQLVILGEIERIWYVTEKAIHGHNPERYVHPFGEKCRPTCPVDHEHHETSGEKPVLMYDRRIKHMFIVGGDYSIHPEGIVN